MINRKSLAVFLAILVAIGIAIPVVAQRPSGSRNSLGVDEVKLSSGQKMYGVVMGQNPQRGVTLLVERQWFEKTYAKQYQKHLEEEVKSLKKSRSDILARLNEWQKDRSSDEELIRFIKEEKTRVAEDQNNVDARSVSKQKFTLVKYSPQEIKTLFVQPAERRKIAGCAWQQGLDRVTNRTTKSLTRELKQQGIDIATVKVDLTDQIPAATNQSDDEWNARVALFEYVLRKELDYQGTSNHLIRIDGQNPVNPQALISQLLGGGLGLERFQGDLSEGGLIDQLMSELNIDGDRKRAVSKQTKWWQATTVAAENEGFRGVRITRVNQEFGSPIAKVETFFFAKMAPGEWKQIASFNASANRDQQDPADIARIKEDPQVKQIMGIMQSLGSGGNKNLIDIALRQGAATEQAMLKCDQDFFDFVNRYTVSTESPPLTVD
jgi:hypothetical protein